MGLLPLVIVTHVLHPAVTKGFLPAAHHLGVPVVLLTDHRLSHLEYFSQNLSFAPLEIVECDVFNPISVINVLQGAGIQSAAIFSNSDHLQTSTALAAEYFGLPAKDWRVCYAAKNKAAMRERLRERNLPSPWSLTLMPGQAIPADAPYPLIVKPREGVASLDVHLCENAPDARRYVEQFWQRQPGRALLLESFMSGPLFTLETLGDGEHTVAVGGFDVDLSESPHFIELEARWNGPVCYRARQQALSQVTAFGVGFGVCHSEFILTKDGPVLVEINYRSIGDGREFMLDRVYGGCWFQNILRLHLGEPLILESPSWQNAMVRYYVADQGGRLAHATDDHERTIARAHGTYHSGHHNGDHIHLTRSKKNYRGMLSVIAESEIDLAQAVTQMESQLTWKMDSERSA